MPLNLLYRYIGSTLSPAGPKAKLSILIYHRVLAARDPIFPNEPTQASFRRQMLQLKNCFNVLPLTEAIARLKAGSLPARAACITFDDGYADNLTLATPILQQLGLHATFFIATAYLNGGRMFNDTVIEAIRYANADHIDLRALNLGEHDIATPTAKATAIGHILPLVKYQPLAQREDIVNELAHQITRAHLPDNLMMTTTQVKSLHAAGMEIGGHTHRHPILAQLDNAAARTEISTGIAYLAQLLGKSVRVFAYPNGIPTTDYLSEHARLVESLGLEGAVSTQRGVSTRSSDLYQLRRFTPSWGNTNRFIPMLLSNLRET
jgi:peptidoglycan/xylan/chitin deacetylase (PgdA/CDA1 family)